MLDYSFKNNKKQIFSNRLVRKNCIHVRAIKSILTCDPQKPMTNKPYFSYPSHGVELVSRNEI